MVNSYRLNQESHRGGTSVVGASRNFCMRSLTSEWLGAGRNSFGRGLALRAGFLKAPRASFGAQRVTVRLGRETGRNEESNVTGGSSTAL